MRRLITFAAMVFLFASGPLFGQSQRIAVLPWYTAQWSVWETELRASAGSSSGVKLGYFPAFAAWPYSDGYGRHLIIAHEGRLPVDAEEVDSIRLGERRSYQATILGAVGCYPACPNDKDVTTGSLVLFFDGPNAASLDNASADAVYRHFAPDGTPDVQVTAPVVFVDEASSEWSASINEGSGSRTMFAVVNLSAGAQAVRVEVFDRAGQLLTSAKTPILSGAIWSYDNIPSVGDVRGMYLDSLPGIRLPDGLFRGTIVFKPGAGGKIAPVIFQTSGSALLSVPVRPVKALPE